VKSLWRWPLRNPKLVTYSFRLVLVSGEATTTPLQRTYPFEVAFETRMMPEERLRKAVQMRARQIAADMAVLIETEVMAGIKAAGGEQPPETRPAVGAQ
jgi:hypothetical protein